MQLFFAGNFHVIHCTTPSPSIICASWPHPPRPINDRPKWSTNIIRVTDQIKERKYIHKMMRPLKCRLLGTHFVHFVWCVDNFRITSWGCEKWAKSVKIKKKSSLFVQCAPLENSKNLDPCPSQTTKYRYRTAMDKGCSVWFSLAIYLSYILPVTALNILRVPGTPIRSQMYHKMRLSTKISRYHGRKILKQRNQERLWAWIKYFIQTINQR